MNPRQRELFENLENLVKNNEAFYRQQFELDGQLYWIYNYRLASYTDFMQPDAIECRGIMFQVHAEGYPLRLASMPMEKFFNLNENPLTMNLDLHRVVDVELKADGSLISTYLHNGEVRLKSKGSIFSEQCLHAMDFLNLPENAEFKAQLDWAARCGWTVNMEWCAPQHRIVIGYIEPRLTVLNVRNMADGKYVSVWEYPWASEIRARYIDRVDFGHAPSFVQSIPEMEGIEGYVARFDNGLRVKIKTKWYLALHHSKDSINSDRRLYEAVLSEATDDLRAMFYEDALVIQRITQMEQYVERIYNHLVNQVDTFYEQNKHLERKDYAILGQKLLDKLYFGLAMKKYLGQEVNYKDFMIAKWKEFGVKDDADAPVKEVA